MVLQLFFRITSYNVCYTKLLRFVKNQHKAFVKRKINEIGEKRQQVSQLSQKNVFSENPSSQIIQRRTEITYNAGAMTYWTSGLHTNNLTSYNFV